MSDDRSEIHEWYIRSGHSEVGPISTARLVGMVEAGILGPHALMRAEGGDAGVSAGESVRDQIAMREVVRAAEPASESVTEADAVELSAADLVAEDEPVKLNVVPGGPTGVAIGGNEDRCYYRQGGREFGPVTLQVLRQFARAGVVRPEDPDQ